MQNSYLYGVNNFSGVAYPGLKDSVYDIKTIFRNDLEILEERPELEEKAGKLINLAKVSDINNQIFEKSNKLIEEGFVPVVFGGDHSLAIGSVSATANNYDNIGVIWIDAHADINNEDTTPSGNIHGMPLSFLMGNGNEDLSKLGFDGPKLKASSLVYLGLRSVDPGEKEILKELGITAYYYEDIETLGLENVLHYSIDKLSINEHIHLSFDFDSMNPDIFPAVSTPVDEGFTEDDVMLMFETILNTNKVRSIDLVEYNKSEDINGKSLDFALKILEYICK